MARDSCFRNLPLPRYGLVLALGILLCARPHTAAVAGEGNGAPPTAEATSRAENEGEPTLRDISTTVGENRAISIDARGVNFLDGEIREAIRGGVEARIEFEVEIERRRTLWFNETVSSLAFSRSLKYDNLKDEYMVTIEGQEDKPEVMKEFSTAQSRVENLKGITLRTTNDPDPSSTYLLRVRARLDSPDLALPSVIRRLLFFAPHWGFDTGWVYTGMKF